LSIQRLHKSIIIIIIITTPLNPFFINKLGVSFWRYSECKRLKSLIVKMLKHHHLHHYSYYKKDCENYFFFSINLSAVFFIKADFIARQPDWVKIKFRWLENSCPGMKCHWIFNLFCRGKNPFNPPVIITGTLKILSVQEYSSKLVICVWTEKCLQCVYFPENGVEREKIEDWKERRDTSLRPY